MFRSLIYVYGSSLVLGLLGIILVPFALHHLGKELFGIFSIYTAISSLITLLDLGVTKDYIRRYAATDNPLEQEKIGGEVLNFYLHLLFAVLIFCVPLAYLNSHFLFVVENKGTIFAISLLCCLEFCLNLPLSYIIAFNTSQEKFGRISSYNVFSGIIRYIILFVGIYFSVDMVKLVAILALRRFLEIIVAKVFLELPGRNMWHLTGNLYKSWLILKRSSVLATSQILQNITVTSGTYLVNHSYGIHALANYRASFDLANRVWFFSNGLGLVIFPRLVKLEADLEGVKNKQLLLSRAVLLSWSVYSIIIVLGCLLAKFVFSLFGIHDVDIIVLFCLLLCGVSINAHSNLSYEILQARGRFVDTIKLSAISLSMLIIFYFLLSKSFGYFAIGYAWIISQTVYSIWTDHDAVGLNLRDVIVRLAIISPVFLLLFYILKSNGF